MSQDDQLLLRDEDYQRLRPVLYGALAHLARVGFAVQPADAEDLMQDFFLREWNTLHSRYDPAQGELENFVFVAFVRFARTWIIRQHSWHEHFQELEFAHTLCEPRAATDPPEPSSASDVAARQAVLSLLESEPMLRRYLEAGPRCERLLARDHGLTRHQVRERLIEALGRVAVAARAHPRLSPEDWRVASALWQEGQTPRSAAASLGRTTEDVQRSRQRIFQILTAALKPLYERKSS